MTIAGLDTNLLYDLTFLARRGSLVGGFDYGGTYTFTGAVTTVIVVNSATNTAYTDMPGLASDDSGRITLTITAGPGAGTDFPVINLLRLASAGLRNGPDLSGPGTDANGDGAPNLVHYALNLSPDQNAANAFSLENAAISNGIQFIAFYERFALARQAAFNLESATNLFPAMWQTVPAATHTVAGENNSLQTIRVETPVSDPHLFLRLRLNLFP